MPFPAATSPTDPCSEVPNEAPVVASKEERDSAVTAGLVADREKAQHTAAGCSARRVDSEEEPMMQVRAVYQPTEE